MTNRDEANKLASKITGETVNASTTKGALEAISGKKAGSIAQAINDIAQGGIPGGGGSSADIEANKEVTIDVSTYTDPVEITPTQGKEGMEKVTVSLSNIPSGGSATVYGWETDADIDTDVYLNISTAPNDLADMEDIKELVRRPVLQVQAFSDDMTYTYVSDTQFIIGLRGNNITFTRKPANDVTLWS